LRSKDETGKQLNILVNGVSYQVALENEFDVLLKKLGMDKLAGNKINNLKAPMPGLVLRLIVEPGATVKKGDPILVLEAMKMENIIKAVGDGVVKKINVSEKIAVEKNQVLVEFE
jgi:biotin carboxyl carrier protein